MPCRYCLSSRRLLAIGSRLRSSCWRCVGTCDTGLSYRDVEELLAERGIDVDHVTIPGAVPLGMASPTVTQISTDPDPFVPFRISQAMQVGDIVYTSGQAAIDMDGNLVGIGDFDAQAEQVFANLAAVLSAAGSDLDKVVKVNIYLTDMSNFGKIVELRERFFSLPYPADTIVEVGALALPELLIEIEAVAVAG